MALPQKKKFDQPAAQGVAAMKPDRRGIVPGLAYAQRAGIADHTDAVVVWCNDRTGQPRDDVLKVKRRNLLSIKTIKGLESLNGSDTFPTIIAGIPRSARRDADG